MAVEASEEVTVFGILVLRVDVEIAVEVDVVAVSVEVADGVANELGVLLVGKGLEGFYRGFELARGAALLYFLLGSSGSFGSIGGTRVRGVSCPCGFLGPRALRGAVGEVYHGIILLGGRERRGLLGNAHGPGILDVGPQPAGRVLDALLVGECLDVVEAVAGPVLDHQLPGGLGPHPLGDEGVRREALAVRELRSGLGPLADETLGNPVADQVGLGGATSALLEVRAGEKARLHQLAVGGVELALYGRGVLVALGHGEELPQALQLHGPGERLFALDVDELVEAPGQGTLEAVVEVRVEALEVARVVGAHEDVVEAQGVVLARAPLALLPREMDAPHAEAVRAEVLVFFAVEGVLGVDGGLREPVEGIPEVVVVLAGVRLAQDLQELIEREAYPSVRRDAAATADDGHDGHEDVLVLRPGQAEVAVGGYPPVLLHAVPVLREDGVSRLGAILVPVSALEHEKRGLFEVDLDLNQGSALEVEEPELLDPAFCQNP